MSRTAGIIISAVIAFVGSAVSILFGALMVSSSITLRSRPIVPPPGQPALPVPASLIFAVMAAAYVAVGVWGIISAIGLLRLRNWARICFVVFGSIVCVVSVFGGFGLLVASLTMPQLPQPPDAAAAGIMRVMFAVFGVLALLSAALGVWWIIYFNRPGVKARFLGGATELPTPQLPIRITIISWFLVVGGASSMIGLVWSFPILFFGFPVHGWAARVIFVLFGVVSLLSGVGMLRKRVEALYLALGYFAFALLNGLAFFAIPGSAARMQDLMREMGTGQAMPANLGNTFMTFGMLIGPIAMIVALWLLISRRRAFIEGCGANSGTVH
jgi:hypothetical protein